MSNYLKVPSTAYLSSSASSQSLTSSSSNAAHTSTTATTSVNDVGSMSAAGSYVNLVKLRRQSSLTDIDKIKNNNSNTTNNNNNIDCNNSHSVFIRNRAQKNRQNNRRKYYSLHLNGENIDYVNLLAIAANQKNSTSCNSITGNSLINLEWDSVDLKKVNESDAWSTYDVNEYMDELIKFNKLYEFQDDEQENDPDLKLNSMFLRRSVPLTSSKINLFSRSTSASSLVHSTGVLEAVEFDFQPLDDTSDNTHNESRLLKADYYLNNYYPLLIKSIASPLVPSTPLLSLSLNPNLKNSSFLSKSLPILSNQEKISVRRLSLPNILEKTVVKFNIKSTPVKTKTLLVFDKNENVKFIRLSKLNMFLISFERFLDKMKSVFYKNLLSFNKINKHYVQKLQKIDENVLETYDIID